MANAVTIDDGAEKVFAGRESNPITLSGVVKEVLTCGAKTYSATLSIATIKTMPAKGSLYYMTGDTYTLITVDTQVGGFFSPCCASLLGFQYARIHVRSQVRACLVVAPYSVHLI